MAVSAFAAIILGGIGFMVVLVILWRVSGRPCRRKVPRVVPYNVEEAYASNQSGSDTETVNASTRFC